jgi:putative ABC transport system permease protein
LTNKLHSFLNLFIALVLRPLYKDPFRTGVTVLGVAIGVSVFLSVQLANRQTLNSFKESVDLVLGRADATIHADGIPFDEMEFKSLSSLRKLIKPYPVIEAKAVETNSGEVVEILGTDLLQDSGIRDFSLKTTQKNLNGLVPLILDQTGIILPEKFIPETSFQPGDKISFTINGKKTFLNVTAVLENKGIAKALNGNFALMDIAAAQNVFEKFGKLDRIDVEFLGDKSFEFYRDKISAILPDYLRVDRPERKNQQVEKMLRAFQYNLTALSFVALLVALYLIYNMVALSVVRRRVEIGTLRALGTSPLSIATIFFLEAGIIGAIGSVLGIALGYYLAEFSLNAVSMTINALYVSNNAGEAKFLYSEALPYFFLGVGLSFFSALLPAIEAATASPTQVMRRGSYDLKIYRGNKRLNYAATIILTCAIFFAFLPPIDQFPFFGFFSVFLLILGCSLFSPSLLLLARDKLRTHLQHYFGGEGLLACLNLAQNVGRNSIAVSSLAIAFMMIISMSIMVHSFRQTVVVWIAQTLKADLFIRPASGKNIDYQHTFSAQKAEKLKNLSEIAAVDLFRAINHSYNNLPIILASGDFSIVSRFGNLVIKSGIESKDLGFAMVNQNQALVSEAFSLKHEVEVGDTLNLNTPKGLLKLKVIAVYYDYSQERGYVVIDRTTFLNYYRDSSINSIVVYLNEKNDLPKVRKEIVKRIGQDQNIIVRTNGELKKEVLRIFDNTFAITYSLEIVAILVAVLGLFNTLLSLVLERQREIGILRFIGAFKQQVKKIVLIEAGILGFIGSTIGLAAGIVVSYLLIYVINKQSFGWTIQVHFPVPFIFIMLISFWSASVIAGWYPARTAANLKAMNAVRAE